MFAEIMIKTVMSVTAQSQNNRESAKWFHLEQFCVYIHPPQSNQITARGCAFTV